MCNWDKYVQDRYIQMAGWTEQREHDYRMNFYLSKLRQEGEIWASVELNHEVSVNTIYDVCTLLRDHFYAHDLDRYWITFDKIEQTIQNSGQEKQAKTIAKLVKKEVGYKLPNDIKSKLGDMLFLPDTKRTIKVRITMGCEGEAHEYYHEGSCYWGEYAASRDYIEASNGGAVRLYENDNLIGRAWWVPYDGDDISNGIMLFNFYGHDSLAKCDKFGNIVAQAFKVGGHGTLCDLSYYGSGSFYQNSDTTYFIGVINRRSANRYRLYITLNEPDQYNYSNEDREYCEDCGEYYHEDDMTYIECMGYSVCESCRDNNYTYVERGEYRYEYYPDSEVVSIDYYTYHINDSEIVEIDGEYYHIEDTVCDEYGHSHIANSDTWRQIETGEIYPADECVYNEETEEWEHD